MPTVLPRNCQHHHHYHGVFGVENEGFQQHRRRRWWREIYIHLHEGRMLLLLLQPRWNSRENEKRHWPELLLLLLLLVQPTRTVGRQQSLRDAHFGACADKSGVPPERKGKEKEKGGLLLPQTRGPLQSILHHHHRP